MKKIAASMGLVALGTSMIHGVETGALNGNQSDKAWSVSASLRGFYDDNINTSKKNKQESYGTEINPSAAYGTAGDMTSVNFTYGFSALYRDVAVNGASSKWDFTHTVGANLSHTFSPRTVLTASDSFVIGQEPDLLRTSAIVGNQYTSGNNLRNYGNIKLDHQLTELLGFQVGYNNTVFDYQDSGERTTVVGPNVVITGTSNSGLLDRMQHGANLDSRWHLTEQTTAIVGYQYSQTDYTGDERTFGGQSFLVGTNTVTIPYTKSDSRNTRSHYLYGGVEHSFTPNLSGSLKVGGIYSDYYNNSSAKAEWSPYVQGSLRYQFLPESTLSVGISVDRNASDFLGSSTNFVKDTETTVAYASVSHRIFAQLYGSGTLTYQHGVYNGGGAGVDGKALDYMILGLNLEYRFTRNFSTSLSYNLDHVTSSLAAGTDYDRNRFYLGVNATY